MIEAFLKTMKRQENYKGQIIHIEVVPHRKARYGELTQPLPDVLQRYLDSHNIRLYSHQATAINYARQGHNVIVVTPTASGKTLAFNIPVFEALIKDKKATALYLYPTKALTNDQLQVLKRMESEMEVTITPNIYDGDTPANKRPRIRSSSRIILSNPYGIHQYLPWHQKWKGFFQHLKFIVIDETHVYRGVFGSNVAMLIRRLLRICKRYGAAPQFILSSATIANPKELSTKLTGLDFDVVANDGAVRGKKYFVFWNPPFIDEARTTRRSTHQETKDLFVSSVTNKFQTLCFTVSRQMAELITRWSRETLRNDTPYLAQAITAYRAGYLPKERREIESRLRTKNLLGVVSTNALELGIDIGSLDSVIISGYPGTVISTWQQAGRAGRTTSDSLVTLVAFQNPLDQYFMKHPQNFFGRSQEHAIIDIENPYIVLGHVMCAAAELPITLEDELYFSPLFEDSLASLESEKLVRKTPRGWVYSGISRSVEVVSLNNISDKLVTVMYNEKLLETMDLSKAYNEAHEGAVLLHQGETYLVEEFDLKNLNASVKKKDVDYYTEPRKSVEIMIQKQFQDKHVGIPVHIGEVQVTEFYHHYVLKTYDEVIGNRPLDLPPLDFTTVGMWFTIPQDLKEEIIRRDLDFEGGIHAIEHAMVALAPLYAMCDRWDIGGVSTSMHYDTGLSTIFIYDGFEGGIGISEKLYELVENLFEATLQLLTNCECQEGCPSCIQSPKCGNGNVPLDKKAALLVLSRIQSLKRPLALTDISDSSEDEAIPHNVDVLNKT